MKLRAALRPVSDIWFVLTVALMPTVREVMKRPTLLFHPLQLSQIFMAKLWIPFGEGTDEIGRAFKQIVITPYAYGSVLDIGAGHGHTVDYFAQGQVTKYIALEPNVNMHFRLRARANAAGFNEEDGTLVILSNRLEDAEGIKSAIGEPRGVDTIIAVLVLCFIPAPQQTIRTTAESLLKPGGQFLYFEHVLSKYPDVQWWQRLWSPIWSFFLDGCKMDRPTHMWLEELTDEQETGSMWSEAKTWPQPGEQENNLFVHSTGRLVKHS